LGEGNRRGEWKGLGRELKGTEGEEKEWGRKLKLGGEFAALDQREQPCKIRVE